MTGDDLCMNHFTEWESDCNRWGLCDRKPVQIPSYSPEYRKYEKAVGLMLNRDYRQSQ